MEKYYLIYGRRLVKGVSSRDDFQLADAAYEYKNRKIQEKILREIPDQLL